MLSVDCEATPLLGQASRLCHCNHEQKFNSIATLKLLDSQKSFAILYFQSSAFVIKPVVTGLNEYINITYPDHEIHIYGS